MLVIGWQYLLPLSNKIIVFHDSLLPLYRGFSPTVNALINGDNEIGVTAFSPREEVDTGPIFKQASANINYPITIKKAFIIQTNLSIRIAKELVEENKVGLLPLYEQNHKESTYSIWRDKMDYLIDWSLDTKIILRTIDALGWPYQGAQSYYEKEKVFILKAKEMLPRKKFVNNSPGKIWKSTSSGIEILTGNGTILLTHVIDENGNIFVPKKQRARFSKEVLW